MRKQYEDGETRGFKVLVLQSDGRIRPKEFLYHTDHTLTDLQLASAHHVLRYPQIASSSVSHHRCSGTVRSRFAHTPTW